MNKKYFNPDNLYGDAVYEIEDKFTQFKGNKNLYFADGMGNVTADKTTWKIYDKSTGERVGEAVVTRNDRNITGYAGGYRVEFHLDQDRIGLQKVKTLPTYRVEIDDLDNVKQIEIEIRKLVMKDFPELGTNWGARTVEPDNKSLYRVHAYNPMTKIMTNLFFVQFRKPLPKPKTLAEIARETLTAIIKEWDVPDSEMSTFTLNQMKFAVVNASDEAIESFLNWYYECEEWKDDPDLEPVKGRLFDLKIGEFKYSQNFEKVKVETFDEIKYWVLNGKHTNELECGRTLVFTNFDPDPENGIDYEEFLFSYLTYTGAEK